MKWCRECKKYFPSHVIMPRVNRHTFPLPLFLFFLPYSGDRGDRRNGDLFLSSVPDGTRKFVGDGTNCTGKENHAHVSARVLSASSASRLSQSREESRKVKDIKHSNWPICSPLSPFCSEHFQTFSISYWGAQSYYPRGLILGVGRISHLPIWMTHRGFSAWGIQTGPFAAL